MKENDKSITNKIKPYKIIYPIIIGLTVVTWMLYKEFDIRAFDEIHFTIQSLFWLIVAALCMAMRDYGYVIRIKILLITTESVLALPTSRDPPFAKYPK